MIIIINIKQGFKTIVEDEYENVQNFKRNQKELRSTLTFVVSSFVGCLFLYTFRSKMYNNYYKLK